jgi:hypothetical protein
MVWSDILIMLLSMRSLLFTKSEGIYPPFKKIASEFSRVPSPIIAIPGILKFKMINIIKSMYEIICNIDTIVPDNKFTKGKLENIISCIKIEQRTNGL